MYSISEVCVKTINKITKTITIRTSKISFRKMDQIRKLENAGWTINIIIK